MQINILPSKAAVGRAAAEAGIEALCSALRAKDESTIVVATGASQFDVLEVLVAQRDVDWSRVTAFHLDEYVGLAKDHPASFRRYLQDRFVSNLPDLAHFEPVDADAPDLSAELARLNSLLRGREVDVCFAGIGENCHLAFNDPPADFETEDPYLVVDLDEACRRQQLGEGWFPSLDVVPRRAVSMSIRQIMKSRRLIVTVPDSRKAEAVRAAVEGEVTPDHPASILQRHPACSLYLDPPAASLLADRAVG